MQLLRIILSPILLPISLIYGFVVFTRNRFYDLGIFKSNKFNIPLISVGNITVGGTGKTPHIEYLVNLLQDKFKIATLSRGYKRRTEGFILSDIKSTEQDIGDEPKQIKQKFPQINVAVDADRTNGINKLIGLKPDTEVILLDDAFQHRKVKPGLSILLIDYFRPIRKDFMIPLGNLRDNKLEKKRADIIVITKSPQNISVEIQNKILHKIKPASDQKVFFSTFSYGNLKAVYNNDMMKNIEEVMEFEILLVTGIANPKSLKMYLVENISKKIQVLEYSDHYEFKELDFKTIESKFNKIASKNKIIITTEKDAMRLQKFSNIAHSLKDSFFYIPVQVEFLNNQTENFNQQIIEYVRKNQANSFIYPK